MQSRKKCLTLTVAVMCLDRSSDRPLPTEITGEPDKAKKTIKIWQFVKVSGSKSKWYLAASGRVAEKVKSTLFLERLRRRNDGKTRREGRKKIKNLRQKKKERECKTKRNVMSK